MRTAGGVGLGPSAGTYFLEEVGYTLGRVLKESTHVVVLRVESVDLAKQSITFVKGADLKGVHPAERQIHFITNGFFPEAPKMIMAWAEPGRTAVMFHNGGASVTCIGGLWYTSYPAPNGNSWTMAHVDPTFAHTFVGHTEDLADLVAAAMRGQEVAMPCVRYDEKGLGEVRKQLFAKTYRLWHMRANPGITDYWNCVQGQNAKDFNSEPAAADAAPAALERQWRELAGDEVGAALKAVWQLTAAGEPAAAFLKDKVRPAVKPAPPDAAELARMRAHGRRAGPRQIRRPGGGVR